MREVINHYDSLIDENNDPVYDPPLVQEYMNKWDGQTFINELQITSEKSVLEIGVGSGRIAIKVCGLCKTFTGIDISPKTIQKAKENLKMFNNITLICENFMTFEFESKFDVIYSSLTFIHIQDKQAAIMKTAELLNKNGRFILSIDKNNSDVIKFETRTIKIYPDTVEDIINYVLASRLKIINQIETEFAHIFVIIKD